MVVIKFKELGTVRKRHQEERIVFCHGTFDLTHIGHVLFLEDCKRLGDVVVVAVTNDKRAKISKGKDRPILNEHIRIEMVDSLKPVDYCFLDVAKSRRNSLEILELIFKKLDPDIYAINEDSLDISYRRGLATRYGIKTSILKKWAKPEYENISTSKIIEKIRNLYKKGDF